MNKIACIKVNVEGESLGTKLHPHYRIKMRLQLLLSSTNAWHMVWETGNISNRPREMIMIYMYIHKTRFNYTMYRGILIVTHITLKVALYFMNVSPLVQLY